MMHLLRLKLSEKRLTTSNPVAAPTIPIDCNKFLSCKLSQYNLNSVTADYIVLPSITEPISHPPFFRKVNLS